MIPVKRTDIISALQSDILRLQGHKPANSSVLDFGLGPIINAFPNKTFPLGAVHEFLYEGEENAAATNGFLAGLLAPLMANGGISLWISATRTLFPPALNHFGIHPDRLVFVDLHQEKDVIRAMDDALKCGALAAVVGELQDISFASSRRLQLAVEQSQVTGFVVRRNSLSIKPTTCISRWMITTMPSISIDDLPGIGFPQWKVELLRIRNGKCGSWRVIWRQGRFYSADEMPINKGMMDDVLLSPRAHAG